ncbi:RDD family protein [Bacillus taeanensis]|uniref:RDD family protein n=1 Tax=Bacillus taeanensis TaxID=273032 RepID=A0A366XZ77_9BACI|nr:RDD family protein [Bacillus taeanensis]RBW71462.1 RDD family protein [Bacillus taeanensis]
MDITFDETTNDTEKVLTGNEVRYAGFWMRFWAYLADLIVIASLNRIFIYPLIKAFNLPSDEPAFLPLEVLLTGTIFYLYFMLMTKFFQQTLGKMIFGLKVISAGNSSLSWSTIIFRELVGRTISKTLNGLFYIWTAFTRKKQGLHDYFADTYVVHVDN